MKPVRSKESLNQKQPSSLTLFQKNKNLNINSFVSDSGEEEFDYNMKKINSDFGSRADRKSCFNSENKFRTITEDEKVEKKSDEQPQPIPILDELARKRIESDIFIDFSFDFMKNYKFYFKHNNPEILISTKCKRNIRRKKSIRSLTGKATRSTLVLRKLNFPIKSKINLIT